MKRILKKSFAMMLAGLMLCMMLSGTAEAAVQYPKTKTLYLQQKGSGNWYYGSLSVSNLVAGETVLKSSVKSSNPSVMYVTGIDRNIYISQDSDGESRLEESDSINLHYTRTGTSKISFKVGKKTYTSTVKVLPYVNPVAQLTISGVKNGSSSNLAGKTGRGCNQNVTLKVGSTQKNAVLSVKAASGWKITYVSYYNKRQNVSRGCSSRGASSLTMRLGNLNKGTGANVYIDLKNIKTGGTLNCSYVLR